MHSFEEWVGQEPERPNPAIALNNAANAIDKLWLNVR